MEMKRRTSRRGLLGGLAVGFTTLFVSGTSQAATRPAGVRKVVFDLQPGWSWDEPLFHGLKTQFVSVQTWIYDGWYWEGVWGDGSVVLWPKVVDNDRIALFNLNEFDGATSWRIRVVVVG